MIISGFALPATPKLRASGDQWQKCWKTRGSEKRNSRLPLSVARFSFGSSCGLFASFSYVVAGFLPQHQRSVQNAPMRLDTIPRLKVDFFAMQPLSKVKPTCRTTSACRWKCGFSA
jgi:hypothetical protein